MKKIIFTLIIISSIALDSIGQGLTLYNMDYVPQSMRNNPSQMQQSNFHIAVSPLFTNVNVSFINNGFTVSDLFIVEDGETKATPDRMLAVIDDNNFISSELNLDFLSFGFKVKEKNYFSFNVTERISFAFDFNRNFMTLLSKGTAAEEFLGKTVSMDGTGFRYNHFREYGLGYTRIVNEKLSIGGRVKLLQGLSHFDNEKTDVTLNTDPDNNYAITATSTIGIRTAGLGFVFDQGSEFDAASYALNFENLGVAIDAGGKYVINDKISTTLNLVDFGFISWKTEAKRYSNNKVEFTFDGLDLNKYLEEGDDYTDELADSLAEIFGLEEIDQPFTTSLIANLYIGGEYKLNSTFTAGALLNTKFFNGQLYPSLTLSTQTNFGKWFQAIASYSIVNRSYNNFGLGAAINMGPLQVYAVSDNLFGWTQMDYAKNLNVQFGMNLLFGYQPKVSKEQRKDNKLRRKLSKLDTDGDGTNDYEDKCPEIAGALNGCTDKDGDLVADNEDVCPDLFGVAELMGCPDQDNDGVADANDSCPDVYGLLFGCPDMDEDSVADHLDPCPSVAGTLGGCPDTDGDGVKDDIDACPEKPGDIANSGCPDTDGDGVYDNDDRCPEIKGSKQYLGCTDKDTDKDEIPDIFDDCPYRSGPESNKGCPVTK